MARAEQVHGPARVHGVLGRQHDAGNGGELVIVEELHDPAHRVDLEVHRIHGQGRSLDQVRESSTVNWTVPRRSRRCPPLHVVGHAPDRRGDLGHGHVARVVDLDGLVEDHAEIRPDPLLERLDHLGLQVVGAVHVMLERARIRGHDTGEPEMFVHAASIQHGLRE